MRNDDEMVGRLLSRREAVALLGISGMAAMGRPLFAQSPGAAPATLPACVVVPEQTEGPYFVDRMLNRTDLRSEPATHALKPGLPLRVTFMVSQLDANRGCTPLPGAQVDVWQCDAAGIYSGVKDPQFDTTGQHFLRGYQTTDAAGAANFLTIYPGWYRGRAVHIHFKIRTTPEAAKGFEFTSQVYFDEGVNDRVLAREPYSAESSKRIRNEEDRIFREQGGKQLLMPVVETADGYSGTFALALHLPGSPASGGRSGR